MTHGEYSEHAAIRVMRKPHRYQASPRVIRGICAVARIARARTIADFGAGRGDYVAALRKVGFEVDGFDGTPTISDLTGGLVQTADLAIRQCFDRKWDIVMSLDVGEHIPAEFEQEFIGNVCRHARKLAVISWATPGTRGWGHVNCRSKKDVAAAFLRQGFVRQEEWTAAMIRRVIHNFRQRIQVFAPV